MVVSECTFCIRKCIQISVFLIKKDYNNTNKTTGGKSLWMLKN